MPPLSILIKPSSSACDLNCRYCFYKDEAANRELSFAGMLDDETTEILIKKALGQAGGSCSFLFQGGEPTLRGLDYYRRFLELEKKYAPAGLNIYHSLQTNGLHIDDEWAEFLAKNGFLTGLSLDGPAEIHDRNRCFPDGGGSFNKVMKAAGTLKRHGADFNILAVVTGQNAKKCEKTYNFFKKNGFRYLQFIPCLEPLTAERGSTGYALSDEDYGRFLIRLFDLWYTDLQRGDYISIRYFDNLVTMLRGRAPEACNMAGRCSLQFVVEGDGTVYPCDFYALDGYEIGNIKKDSFTDMASSQAAKRFTEASVCVPDECRTCCWYRLCRNGCRRDRACTDGIYGRNTYCRAYKMFFEAEIQKLMRIAGSVGI